MACLPFLKSLCVEWWSKNNLSTRPLYFIIACYFLYWMYGICYGFLWLFFHISSFSFVKKVETFSCSLTWAFLWRYWSGRTFTILRYTLNIARLCCWLLSIFLSYTLIKNKIKLSSSIRKFKVEWDEEMCKYLVIWLCTLKRIFAATYFCVA